jgi:hypothetical protein
MGLKLYIFVIFQFLTMFNTIVGAGAALRYGTDSLTKRCGSGSATLVSRHENLLGFKDLCKELTKKCLLAVSLRWRYPAGYMQFWSVSYNDNPVLKLQLLQEMSQVICFQCSPPKLRQSCLNCNQLTCSVAPRSESTGHTVNNYRY